MTTDELLISAIDENQSMLERVQRITSELTDEQLNTTMPTGEWSIAQVLQHLILGNAPYFERLTPLISNAQPTGPTEIKTTWFGRVIYNMAGPSGNAPAPKAMIPEVKVYGRDVVQQWCEQQLQCIQLLNSLLGKDINQIRFKNPFIRFVRMNATDAVRIMTTHNDRHVRQVWDRASELCGAVVEDTAS